MKIKSVLFASVAVLLAASSLNSESCFAESPTPSSKTSAVVYSPPTKCTDINVPSLFPGPLDLNIFPKIIAPDSTVSPGSPVVLNPKSDKYFMQHNHGLSCDYGVQNLEIGGTIYYAKISNDIFTAHIPTWRSNGYVKASITGVTADQLYILKPGRTAEGYSYWGAQMYTHGIWVGISASYVLTAKQEAPVINAAIATLRKVTVSK